MYNIKNTILKKLYVYKKKKESRVVILYMFPPPPPPPYPQSSPKYCVPVVIL